MTDIQTSEIESIAQSMIPNFSDDGKKATYLGHRIANLSFREACQLTPVSEKQVRRWRESDPNFNHVDTDGLTELRKLMANQLVDMQFTRNFHLVLQKDFKVLYKDATLEKNETLTENEQKYLDKIRQHYTPQSLAMVKQLLGGGSVDQPFDFTKVVMTIKREQIEITEERR